MSEHRVLAHMPHLTLLLESTHRLSDHTGCSTSIFGVMLGRHTLSNNVVPRPNMLRNSRRLHVNHPLQILIDPVAGVHDDHDDHYDHHDDDDDDDDDDKTVVW
eukprot:4143635-Amphidinium_carterae.2